MSWPAAALLAVVRAYQVLLSPLVGGACRFHPSCSQYMAEAVGRYGAARGGWLGLRRLARCHPFGGHGLDPVPESWPSRHTDGDAATGTACRGGRRPPEPGEPGSKVR